MTAIAEDVESENVSRGTVWPEGGGGGRGGEEGGVRGRAAAGRWRELGVPLTWTVVPVVGGRREEG